MKLFEIILCSIIAIIAYVLSYFQFREKGVLLNNAYLFASTEERKKMDKKPHFRQSGIVFLLLGTIFALNVIQIVTEWNWIFFLIIAIIIVTIIYAIVSSIRIEMKK